MKPMIIDINADVGEGLNNESQLLPYLSSCNIACGGHAGDLDTMRHVARLAKKHGVKIGAHPSFPDKQNFGRTAMNISCAALFTSIKDQIDDLIVVLKEEQVRLHHIKPHGALYNLAAVDSKIAAVIIEVMKSFLLPIKLYVPYNSVIEKLAIENDIPIMYEAFADRNYNDDGTLVSRTENNALIDNSTQMFEHVFRMIKFKKVRTITNSEFHILADTFCIHGDNPNAVVLIKNLTIQLAENNIQLR